MSNERKYSPEGPYHRSLKESLIEATFDPNRAISDSVRSIDVFDFRQDINSLLRLSQQDPLHRETGKVVYVTSDKRVLVQNDFIQGTETSVVPMLTMKVNVAQRMGPKVIRQDRYLGTVLHTHGVSNTPPSPADLKPPFHDDFKLEAASAAFIITPERNYAIYRGERTPMLPDNESTRLVEKWNRALENRVEQHIDYLMTPTQVTDIHNRANAALLRDIVKRYDLRMFTGPQIGNILTRSLR